MDLSCSKYAGSSKIINLRGISLFPEIFNCLLFLTVSAGTLIGPNRPGKIGNPGYQ